MSRVELRSWQVKASAAVAIEFQNAVSVGSKPRANVAACVGSGKTTLMTHIGYESMFGDIGEIAQTDFVVFIAPSESIIGSTGGADCEPFGIMGSLLKQHLWPAERITADRMPGLMSPPRAKMTDSGLVTGASAVFTYQYLCQPRVIDTLSDWARQGVRIGVHYDEKHHVPEDGSAWSEAAKKLFDLCAYEMSYSGTWWRTDGRTIHNQRTEETKKPVFTYSYADAIRDGWDRPVSFWVPDTNAKLYDPQSGILIDERPVTEYLDVIPPEVRDQMFDPNGWYVGNMIRRAADELRRRRLKYPDAGCLVACPPGLAKGQEERFAEIVHRRIPELTGMRSVLFLNGMSQKILHEYRRSDDEFLVAVNRVSEGADVPRLFVCLCLRDLSNTDLLFTQILGRILRRRKGDDVDEALLIMPAVHGMMEQARQVQIDRKHVEPKKVEPCSDCQRIPCRCPCRRCGKRRPCDCPCSVCGERPCVCDEPAAVKYFVELDGLKDSHITNGTDIEDQYAIRAGLVRDRVEGLRHRDLAGIGLILQCDAQVNGTAHESASPDRSRAIEKGRTWTELREGVPVKMKAFQRLFRHHGKDRSYAEAWNHINRKFFGRDRFQQLKSPDQLSMEKLREVHAYMDRCVGRGEI